MVKAGPFDSTRRYPVVFAIYGGPGSQQVYDSWGASTWNQWLAQQGYVVVGVNNRGSNNYGRDFMKIAYQRLGYWEALFMRSEEHTSELQSRLHLGCRL